jgi:energy-coupling factor transporter ATP-binding protein EcfA2
MAVIVATHEVDDLGDWVDQVSVLSDGVMLRSSLVHEFLDVVPDGTAVDSYRWVLGENA